MEMRSLGEDAYFAASNSGGGFHSDYARCFDAARVKHVYAVKGGPGTGKSRFLRDVAEYAEGRGWTGEYIYCSSDPDSLDGVILSRGEDCVALMDATAPHVYEPTRPGIREELVDLGAFWDRRSLEAHAEEIGTLSAQKSEAYRRAYRYLAGMEGMLRNRDALVLPHVRREAIRAHAEKLMRDVGTDGEYAVQTALMRSVGMRGEVGFDTYFARAKKILLIEDCHGVAQYLMHDVGQLALERRLRIRLSHDPVCPDRIDAIGLSESGVTFAVCSPTDCQYPFKSVPVRRFLDVAGLRAVRGELLLAERMSRAMLDGAKESLAAVRDLHFRIEAIYIDAMDFVAKENFTKIFCERLFDLQNG